MEEKREFLNILENLLKDFNKHDLYNYQTIILILKILLDNHEEDEDIVKKAIELCDVAIQQQEDNKCNCDNNNQEGKKQKQCNNNQKKHFLYTESEALDNKILNIYQMRGEDPHKIHNTLAKYLDTFSEDFTDTLSYRVFNPSGIEGNYIVRQE